MNQFPNSENKLFRSLLKRLQELEQENQVLKSKLTETQNPTEPYFQIKELVICNKREEQICSLCDCELSASQAVNSLKLYFCAKGCSLFMEKLIDDIIYKFRKERKK